MTDNTAATELTPENVADDTVAKFLTCKRVRRAYDDENPWAAFSFALGSELMHESIRALVVEAVAADRSNRTLPAVVIRAGECFENDQVTVYDMDFLSQPRSRCEYSDEDLDRMMEDLAKAGFDTVADEVADWR